MVNRRRLVGMAVSVALVASGLTGAVGPSASAASGAVVVLDTDDDDGRAVWPTGVTYGELDVNTRLAGEVKTRLERGCGTTVVLTRGAAPGVVPRGQREQVALGAGADLMVTIAFNALSGTPWGFTSDDGGPIMHARAQDSGFAAGMLRRVQQFTGRPERASALRAVVTAQGAPGLPWYAEFGDLPFPYLHAETLFMDNNWDSVVIGQRFDLIADGVYAGILDQLGALGKGCSAYPDVPPAEELSRLRNLGLQNFQEYGGDPVSLSTGNFATGEATVSLTGVGDQAAEGWWMRTALAFGAAVVMTENAASGARRGV